MTSNESDLPNRNNEASSGDEWGNAWEGAASSAKPSAKPDAKPDAKPNAKLDAKEQGEDSWRAPEGIEDFKAARREAATQDDTGDQPKPKAKRTERLRPREVVLRERVVDHKGIEEKEWSSPTVFNPKWVTLITLAIMALFIIGLKFMQQGGNQGQRGNKKTQREVQMKALEAEAKELFKQVWEAQDLYLRFASAQGVEEFLPIIRNSQEVSNLVRQAEHQALVEEGWRPNIRTTEWEMHVLQGKPYATLSGELPDYTTFCAYYALEANQLRLDWKATTTYNTAEFSEMVIGKGDGSEVRGFLMPAALYTDTWPEQKYQCFQFESPDQRHFIWVYVQRDSPVIEQLNRIFGAYDENAKLSEISKRVTLELSPGSDQSLPNQWGIEELLHQDWINMP